MRLLNEIFVLLGFTVLVSYILYYYSKNKTVDQICKHPELSDAKVDSITTMMGKHHENFFKNLFRK